MEPTATEQLRELYPEAHWHWIEIKGQREGDYVFRATVKGKENEVILQTAWLGSKKEVLARALEAKKIMKKPAKRKVRKTGEEVS